MYQEILIERYGSDRCFDRPNSPYARGLYELCTNRQIQLSQDLLFAVINRKDLREYPILVISLALEETLGEGEFRGDLGTVRHYVERIHQGARIDVKLTRDCIRAVDRLTKHSREFFAIGKFLRQTLKYYGHSLPANRNIESMATWRSSSTNSRLPLTSSTSGRSPVRGGSIDRPRSPVELRANAPEFRPRGLHTPPRADRTSFYCYITQREGVEGLKRRKVQILSGPHKGQQFEFVDWDGERVSLLSVSRIITILDATQFVLI